MEIHSFTGKNCTFGWGEASDRPMCAWRAALVRSRKAGRQMLDQRWVPPRVPQMTRPRPPAVGLTPHGIRVHAPPPGARVRSSGGPASIPTPRRYTDGAIDRHVNVRESPILMGYHHGLMFGQFRVSEHAVGDWLHLRRRHAVFAVEAHREVMDRSLHEGALARGCMHESSGQGGILRGEVPASCPGDAIGLRAGPARDEIGGKQSESLAARCVGDHWRSDVRGRAGSFRARTAAVCSARRAAISSRAGCSTALSPLARSNSASRVVRSRPCAPAR